MTVRGEAGRVRVQSRVRPGAYGVGTWVLVLAVVGACASDAMRGAEDSGGTSDGDGAAGLADVVDDADAMSVDGAPQVSHQDIVDDVAWVPGPAVAVSGRVALTGPVVGAIVEAWALGKELEAISAVAEGTTDADGVFALAVPSGGWVEVRARGTKATYPAGEGTETFDVDDALTVVIDLRAGEPVYNLNLHAWTTVATRLARAYVGAVQDAAVAEKMARSRLEEHLWRPDKWLLNHTKVWMSGDEGFSGGSALLGLTHAGLRGIAARWSVEAEASVKVIDVVTALMRDAGDGVLDGLTPAADGSVLGVNVKGVKPVTVDTTRWELARAIFDLTPELDQAPLLAPGGLYEDLALDDGPLYPPVAPRPFDPLAPGLAWEEPTPAEGTIVGSSPTVKARAWDVGGVSGVTGTATGEGEVVPLSLVALSVLPDERVVAALVPLDTLPDGLVKVRVEAVDAAGNVGELTRVLHVDRTAPVVTFVEPAASATAQSAAVASGSVADPTPREGLAAGVKSLEVRLNGKLLSGSWSGTSWSAKADYAYAGEHTWAVRATDEAGNVGETQRVVLWDPNGPSVSIDEPGYGAWVTTDAVAASGVVTDAGVGVAGVVVGVKGGAEVAAKVDGKAWTASLTGVADGVRMLVVEGTDALGNTSEVERPFGVDRVAPQIGVAPGLDGGFFASASVTVSGTASDATSGVALVRLTASGAAPVEATPTGDSWSAVVPLLAGGAPTVVQVVAQDVAGNESKPVQVTVTADLEPPVVSITTPAPDKVWFNTATLTLGGVATDGISGVASVWVVVDGEVGAAQVVAAGAKGAWTWTAPISLLDGGGQAAQGAHVVAVYAVDVAGNTSVVVERVLMVDTLPPVVGWGSDEGYVPDALCNVVANGNTVAYQCPPDANLKLKDLCLPHCGVLRKFPHRLGQGIDLWTGAALKGQNVPHLGVLAQDAGPPAGAPPLVVQYRFLWPGILPDPGAGWAPMGGAVLPIASPLFMKSQAIPDSKTLLPTGLQVRAVDVAGNASAALEVTFTLELVTPPLLMEPVSAPLTLADGPALSISGGTAHAPFRATPVPARFRQLRLWNPYPMPLQVGLLNPSWPLSKLHATASGARHYGAKTALVAAPLCGGDACIYEATTYAGETPAGGACQDLSAAETVWSRVLTSPTFSMAVRTTPDGQPAPTSGAVSIPASSSVWLDLLAAWPGTCALLDPVPLSTYGTGYVYVRPDGEGCASATPHPLTDKATCFYQDKCGFDCPATGTPPCATCTKQVFVRPWLSLASSVRIWTPPGETVKLPVSVEADGATPIPWTANQVPLVVDVAVTASPGEAVPFPHW
ncbi:MAG: hypothetical protein AMXMBFR64_38200 [Myxococcales bacterium]